MRKTTLSTAAALAGASTVAVMLSACGAPSSADSATCPNGKIQFGIEPYEDPAKLTPAYEVLAKALSKKLDCPVEVTVVEDYSAEVLAMQNGKLDLGQFGPLGFVFASDRAKAEPLASFGTADKKLSTYTAGIWVKKNSTIRSVSDLKGKSLALGGVGSTSGDAQPRQALADAHVAEKDLKVNYTGGHPEALLALTNGTVDAAEINSQTLGTATESGTFKSSGFRQVWESVAIPNDPITVRGDANPAFKKAVKAALLSLPVADVAKVGKFLDVTPPGPLVAVSKDTYKPMFKLAATLHLTEKDV